MVLRSFLCRVQGSKQVGVQQSSYPRDSADSCSAVPLSSLATLVCSERRREQERQQQTARQTYRDAVVERDRFDVAGAVYRTTCTAVSYTDMKRRTATSSRVASFVGGAGVAWSKVNPPFVPLLLRELMFVFQCRPAFIFLCICGPLTEGLLHTSTRFAAAKKRARLYSYLFVLYFCSLPFCPLFRLVSLLLLISCGCCPQGRTRDRWQDHRRQEGCP